MESLSALHHYKYDWLRPSVEEIITAYKKLYGKKSRDSDVESDGSSEPDEEAHEEDGEEEAAHEEGDQQE